MRVTVCQLRDDRDGFAADWSELCAHSRRAKSELVLLPEMPFAPWFAETRTFDPSVWGEAVDSHRRWESRFSELGAPFVMSTRPVDHDARRLNEAFIATPDGATAFHHKRYLPDEEAFWEASWYERGDETFDLVRAMDAAIGVQICTEMWMLDLSRQYGLRGADIIAVPRATPATSRDRWVVGARAAAIVSGAFCISSNHSGTSTAGEPFAGQGWIVDPDGEVLALTSDAERFVTRELDLRHARVAKTTYPRYVR